MDMLLTRGRHSMVWGMVLLTWHSMTDVWLGVITCFLGQEAYAKL